MTSNLRLLLAGWVWVCGGMIVAAEIPRPASETPMEGSWGWSVRSIRESMALFPPSSVVRDLGDGRALTRLVRTKSPSGDPEGGLIVPLTWLPDRSALYMKSSLWIEEERRGDGSWQIRMVATDGSTTTTVDFAAGKTKTRTEMAPVEKGRPMMVDELEESGEIRPPDCLDLRLYRPGRFAGLEGGNAGCPMTAMHTYRSQDGSTVSLMADVGWKGLLQETITYSTATLVVKTGRPFEAGSSRNWPSQVIQQRLDPDGTVAQWTTHSLLQLDVQVGGSP